MKKFKFEFERKKLPNGPFGFAIIYDGPGGFAILFGCFLFSLDILNSPSEG